MKHAHKWVMVAALSMASAACGGTGQTSEAAADAATEATPETAAGVAARPAEASEAPKRVTRPKPTFREVTIPVGTTLRLDLAASIASDTSQVEDPVSATLRQPVVVDGATVIPTGAELIGHVTHVEGSGRVKGRAQIAYRFSALTVGDERYDVNTESVSHVAEATKKKDATKIGIAAGAGAAVGALLGGGSGAATGAAIGGAGGTGLVLATKGEEVRLGPGTNVSTKLTAPLTLRLKL